MPDARTHPSPQQLANYRLAKLPAAERSAIHAHLAGCAECRQMVENLPPDSFIGQLQEGAAQGASMLPTIPPSPSRTSLPAPQSDDARPVDDVPPELLGSTKFSILGKLGQGGMGAVYKAKHNFFDELVAIKVMTAAVVANADARSRFLREMKAAGKLKHANIVRAIDAEQIGDLLVLVMEFVPGVALDRLVKQRGPLPVDFACGCIVQAARGLQHAHEKGLVHRDIKPANLMVATKEKQVKVLDFGLVRGPRESMDAKNQTQMQAFMGTPEYVAPEQATDARNADIRADVYSLGCTLYFLLAGRPPFQTDSIMGTIVAQIQEEARPLPELRAEVPAGLWSVVAKMLAKKPAERYQTPGDVAEALKPFVTGAAKAKRENARLVGASLKTAPKSSPAPIPNPLAVPVQAASPFDDLVEALPSTGLMKKARMGRAFFAALPLVLLAPLGLWLAIGMLRVETPNGTLIVEMNSDEVEARIRNGKLILSGPDGKVRYTLTANDRSKKLEAGSYSIRVEGADGLVLDTPKFTIRSGCQVTVCVTLERKAVVKKDPPSLTPDRNLKELLPAKPEAPKREDVITNLTLGGVWLSNVGPVTIDVQGSSQPGEVVQFKGSWMQKNGKGEILEGTFDPAKEKYAGQMRRSIPSSLNTIRSGTTQKARRP